MKHVANDSKQLIPYRVPHNSCLTFYYITTTLGQGIWDTLYLLKLVHIKNDQDSRRKKNRIKGTIY